MANVVPAGSLYKFLSHKRKVCSLYKKSLRSLECWCWGHGRHVYSYERTLLRARFDKHKDEADPNKATQLLRLGEEEFWVNQHPVPMLFPNEPGGTKYQREWTHQAPLQVMDDWLPEEKGMFPDYFAKREKWFELRSETWPKEMETLQEWDKLNIEKGVPMTDAMPAAKEKDGYPPFWWRAVTRPLENPQLMKWFPGEKDHW